MIETAATGPAGVVSANAALGSRHALGKATVQLSGTASLIPVEHFQEAARQSAAIRELALRYNDLFTANLQQTVACNAVHDLNHRLCRWLLEAHDCCDGGAELPLTQAFLSEMLAVRRTSVTVAARKLQDEGLINYSRGRVRIVSRASLESRACECYFAVRDHSDKLFPRISEHR
jgi:hypothetical protein